MNIAPFIEAPLILKLHMCAAVLAIFIGAWQFLAKKGTINHKMIGWLWVLIMAFVAISAIFLPEKKHSTYFLTIVLNVWVICGLPLAIYSIKSGKIMLHRAFMLGLYIGALIIAFTFTLTPDRLLYKVFFNKLDIENGGS